MYWG